MTASESETTPLTGQSPSKGGRKPLLRAVLALALLALIVGVWSRFGSSFVSSASTKVEDEWMPNVVNVSGYSMPITIVGDGEDQDESKREIQRLFDASLMECFGFAFLDAQATASKALQAALDLSIDCPMCYWLLAMTHAPFINHPTASQKNYQMAKEASQLALQLLQKHSHISPKEQGLIHALQLRFNSSVQVQSIGYLDYKNSLQEMQQQFPDDPDVLAFLADSIMVLNCDDDGYHFYQDDNLTPLPAVARAIQFLEHCLVISNHPLCSHLYIHITEPSENPSRAEMTADRLNQAAHNTQAQHLQHMPSHTYLRVGRYHDAILANIQAHHSDQAYLDHHHLPYGPAHDTAFLVIKQVFTGGIWHLNFLFQIA